MPDQDAPAVKGIGGFRFERKEAAPAGAAFRPMFIQCASCRAVVGVTEYLNVPVLIEKIAKKLGVNLLG